MTDVKDEEKTFKVEDRRTSSGAGEEEKPAGETVEAAGAPSGEKAESDDAAGSPPEGEGGITQVDFSTFIFSLFSSALIQLGDMADPITGKMEKNVQAAKQTIDILDILARKTEGNLSEEEDNLLKNAAAELKWKYLDTVKGDR
jgi:hypothetical protein